MKRNNVPAYAKVNLFLEVGERRADGYHDIVSVMQRLSLSDDVSVALTDGGVNVFCDADRLSGRDNIAYKAAETFFNAAGISCGADIYIKKKIPQSAGLGGGSSDAATVIILLNELCGKPLTDEKLLEAGFSVGADVPFFISGCRTALVGGAGERITPLNSMPECFFVIAVSGEKQSTGEMYKKLDMTSADRRTADVMTSAILENNLVNIGKNLYNAFERLYHADREAVEVLRCGKPLGVCLCGSGPCEFALFGDRASAEETVKLLEKRGIAAHLAAPV